MNEHTIEAIKKRILEALEKAGGQRRFSHDDKLAIAGTTQRFGEAIEELLYVRRIERVGEPLNYEYRIRPT